jgi:hypothetical protein
LRAVLLGRRVLTVMDGRDDERNPAVIRPLLPHSSRRALLRLLFLSHQRGDHFVIRVDLHAAGSIAACTPLPRCHPAVPTLASVVESLTSDTSAPLELRSNGLPVEILAAGAPIAFHFPTPHLTPVLSTPMKRPPPSGEVEMLMRVAIACPPRPGTSAASPHLREGREGRCTSPLRYRPAARTSPPARPRQYSGTFPSARARLTNCL